MKKITAIFLCCLLTICSTASDVDKGKTTSTTSKPTTPSTTSTTAAPTTPSTTTAPTTPSTTAAPTTPSTTAAPTSTPTPPKPTPVPPPSDGKWSINGTDGKITCIVAEMAAQLSIKYLPEHSDKTETVLIDVPVTAKANGTCNGNKEEFMQLFWNSNNLTQSLTFHFGETEKLYNLHHIDVQLDSKLFPNSTFGNKTVRLTHKAAHYNTSIGNSYRCLKLQTFSLEADSEFKNVTGDLKVSNLQFQAFRNDNTTSFGAAEDCAFDTPDIVPIAVGGVLALLVVIVLAAYLISRRRSQARGYLSM